MGKWSRRGGEKPCKIRVIGPGDHSKCIKWSRGKRRVPIEKELGPGDYSKCIKWSRRCGEKRCIIRVIEYNEPLVLDLEQHKEDTDEAGLHSWAPAGKMQEEAKP